MTTEFDANLPPQRKGRRTKAAQQAQWQFQAHLLDQISDAVIAVDQDERITYLNRTAVIQYGVDPINAIGQPLSHAYRYEWLQPEDELRADAALAQQGRWRGENRHIRHDGSTLHVESLVTVLRNEAGNAIGLLATIRDITDRKQVEHHLRASELRYRRLADTMPQLVWTANATGIVDYYNIHIHDFDPAVWQGATGFDWESLIHPEDLVLTLTTWQQAVNQRQPYSCEHRLHMADGSWRWHLSRALLVQDPVQGFKWYGTATDIHERKLVEEALRENEAQLQTILQNVPVSVYLLTTDQRYLYVNRHYEDLAGIPNAEIQGKSIYDMFDPATATTLVANDQRALAAKVPLVLEEFAPQHGEIHTYASIKTPLLNADGEPYALLGISTDITERKVIEEALRANEARLRQLADAMPQIVWQADADGINRYFNQRWLDYTGLTLAESLADTNRAIHPDDQAEVSHLWQEVRPLGQPYESELRLRRADGAYRWHLTRCMPIYNNEGQLLCWYGTSTDIDAGKRATEALRASEERLRLATEAGGVGIFDHDLNTNQTVISALYAQIIGLPPDTVVTREVWLSCVHPEDRPLVEGIWQAAQATGASYYYECRILRPDGALVWIEVNAWVTPDKTGRGARITGAVRDITERKQVEADQQLLADLAEQIRLADEATALVAAAVRLVGDHLQVGRCLWIEVDEAQQRGFIQAQHCRGLPPVALEYAQTDYSPSTRTELMAGRVLVNYDAQSDPRTAAFYETIYAPQQKRAYVGVPVLREGLWRGILSVTVPDARQWQPREIHLLETVAEQVWLAMEKLRLHAEVRQANERFTLAEAAVPGWIYDYDWRTGQVTRSDGFQRVLGYAPEECQPTAAWWPSLMHPDDWQWLAQETGPYIPSGDLRLLEYRVRDRDGHYHHIWDRARVIRDESGAVIRLVGSSVDISERKGAEAALQQSNAILRGVLESSNDAIFVRDLTGRYLLVNHAGAEQVGLPKAAISGRRYQEIFDPATVAAIAADDQPVFAQGISLTLEHMSERNGVKRYWHTLKMPLRNAEGAIIGLISSARDLTERKAAEEALRLSEARFRHLAEAMPQIVWTCQADGSMTYINQQWEQYSGLTTATTLAAGMWSAIHPADRAATREQWRQALVSGAAYQGEIRLRRHDGAYCWFLERAIPVRDEAGAITQWFGVSMDIDERKRQERHQQFLSELGMDLRLLSDTETILTQLVERLGAYLQVAGCRVNEVDLQREQFTLLKDWVADDALWLQVATPGIYPFTELAPPTLLAALQAGQTVAIANTLHDSRTAPVANHYEHDQVHSLIGVPIFHQGQWRATLSVKGHSERQWLPDEVTLLEAVAGQISALLEKVHAEEALRASEERLRLALAGGGMGIWESPIATNHSLWSPEMYALFDLAPDLEITDELFNRLVHPDDLAGLQAAINNLVMPGGEREYNGEFRIIRPDGEVRWLADRVTVICDETDLPVRLLGINFDITERKEREAMIRQQLAEIEAIYATAPVGLCLVDRDLRYMRINETLATINGSTIAEQLGRSLAETQPAEGYLIIEPLYRRVIETGMPLLNQEVHESHVDPVQARDWLASYYPLKNGDGVVIGVNAVILEITERKRYERQLEELNASLEKRVGERTKALEQANRALSITNRELEQFTYAAAHDLRTPLRGIANLVQWISEDAAPVLPLASQRHLDKLGGRVKRLEKMLEDLLAYSRVGRVRYQPEMVDVQQMVHGLVDLLTPPAGFVIKSATALPTFVALRAPLELVFRNLLSNAIRHHHDPGRGHAAITVRDRSDWYEFCLSDNGPGIDRQYHERIFGMFQTLKPRDEVEGSGIGLALVKKMIESMGGRIWVESALGQGTSFYFTWPKEPKTEGKKREGRG